jgi:predicted enzyme related to lactoylglutathione lyase
MASTAPVDRALDAMGPGAIPASRTVTDLAAALDLVRRLGGSILSEIRTAPGIASWAFVARSDGSELLLWENAVLV